MSQKPLYPKDPVLLVDDEASALRVNELCLRAGGINHVRAIQDSTQVLTALEAESISVVLLDLHMPGESGDELLPVIVREYPATPVIVVTGANDVGTAVECMRGGAFDYMVKPVERSRLVSGVQRALEFRELQDEYREFRERALTNTLEHPEAFAGMVAASRAMDMAFLYSETIAKTMKPVLITGESGAGKELFARAIHAISGRSGPFVPVNVAGLDDTVFSDSLFGHVRGAYTGADDDRRGLIEQAAHGTLFLDEVGELSQATQVKLLRMLQDREYYPLGSDSAKPLHARIVAATNADLLAAQHEGRFRKDLYHRLCAHHLHVPALRDRRDDLPVLLDHFLERAAQELGKKKPRVPLELLQVLNAYSFPGNVRELENMVFDAMAVHESMMLSTKTFREHIARHRPDSLSAGSNAAAAHQPGDFSDWDELPTLRDIADRLIQEALRRADGNQTIASQLLGLSRTSLNKRLRRQDP